GWEENSAQARLRFIRVNLACEFRDKTMKEFILAALVLQLSAVGCHLQSQRTTYAGPDSAPFRAMHLPAGTHPSMLSIADVNRDGNADILVANGGSGDVSVYLGDGKGNFSQPNGSTYSA